AVDAARADAAGRQASLAPLFADLAEALNAPDLPAPTKAAIGQLLALRTAFAAPLTAETIRQAVAQSGLFLEAHVREGEADQPDLKAALLTLQRALAAAPSTETARTTRPLATPPPVREAGLTPQPVAPATLSASDATPVIVARLAREVDQAVARQTLHQLASLPDGQAPSWLFELPVATPHGTAVAQFEIDRDGRQSGTAAGPETWRVRFSIDIEPLGPVHVHLGLHGDRASVTVWAEREDGLARLRSLGAELSQALPADVVFHPGIPRRPLPENGQFVDRAL
ncbi:MAG: flagellar hook-length control protein FliK, partial [Phenylobacterium sp.]